VKTTLCGVRTSATGQTVPAGDEIIGQLSQELKWLGWRRGRDLNPRYGCPYAAFRVRCDRPLCHLSMAAGANSPSVGRYVSNAASRDKGGRAAGRFRSFDPGLQPQSGVFGRRCARCLRRIPTTHGPGTRQKIIGVDERNVRGQMDRLAFRHPGQTPARRAPVTASAAWPAVVRCRSREASSRLIRRATLQPW
jgi:hypothetical protein